jgi:3-dehydroquinate synthase
MPSFRVETPHATYSAVVERGILGSLAEHLPGNRGKLFVVTTDDVWNHQGAALHRGLAGVEYEILRLPGGEENKRLAPLEAAAEEMVLRGADRTSIVLAFGGGIVTDMAGFLAAIFMRGIPVIHAPTTLLAQVDAAIGGKTGVNLQVGKNLAGAFHQPLAVLIDPAMLETLPEREYRAGLYEVIKAGIIRDAGLFALLESRRGDVLAREAGAVDSAIAAAVRMKAEVVSADERERGLRRILNLGHTFGHALEAETAYTRFLHGEAVAFGMLAAAHLAEAAGCVSSSDASRVRKLVEAYGPIPPLDGIPPENLLARLVHDKKTVRGKVHFVVPTRIGEAQVISGVDSGLVMDAIRSAFA